MDTGKNSAKKKTFSERRASIFGLETKEEAFGEKFNCFLFIDNITRNAVAEVKRTGDEDLFHPEAIQSVFSKTLDDLIFLADEVDSTVHDLEKKKVGLEEYTQDSFSHLFQQLAEVGGEFHEIEQRINSVGNAAVRIGEQLDSFDSQKSSGMQTVQLLNYFQAFNSEKCSVSANSLTGLPGLFSGPFDSEFYKPEASYTAATLTAKLMALVSEMESSPSVQKGKENVTAYNALLVDVLLSHFQTATDNQNIEQMRSIASVLSLFSGRAWCVNHFMAAHPLLSAQDSLPPTATLEEEVTFVRQQCSRLLKELLLEKGKIEQVFSDPGPVLQALVERVCQHRLHPMIEHALNMCPHSSLSRLRMLHSIFLETTHFVDQLESFEKMKGFTLQMDKVVDELFIAHRQGYVSDEVSALHSMFASQLTPFDMLVNRLTAKRRFKRGVQTAPVTPTEPDSPHPNPKMLNGLPSDSKAAWNPSVVPQTPATAPAVSIGNNTPSYGLGSAFSEATVVNLVNLEVVLSLLHIASESVVRCRALAHPPALTDALRQITTPLVQHLATHYFLGGLQVAFDHLSTGDAKSAPSVEFLSVVQVVNHAVHLFQNHLYSLVLPAMATTNARSQTAHDVGQALTTAQVLVQKGLHHLLTHQLRHAERLLTINQKKTDYKPKENSTQDGCPTLACRHLCEFIKGVGVAVKNTLDGNNYSTYMAMFGLSLHDVILTHMQHFTFSDMGGLRMVHDASLYLKVVEEWKIEEVTTAFTYLKDASNIFVVSPENIDGLFLQGPLAKAPRMYLKMQKLRADSKKSTVFKGFIEKRKTIL